MNQMEAWLEIVGDQPGRTNADLLDRLLAGDPRGLHHAQTIEVIRARALGQAGKQYPSST
jgi:hypothetical protein